ncbi:afadin- and alpha-actinin-binding protein-like [Aphidius gifuensis]|uniref:afadin- and alpha-actinin-binding protein-like n=1 Tax=Aphidius gifuensis TaxID=684658 RepID=UPI001CDBD608|nr:afadin- and alpha-actinin-binding protein-like [Aphidius gifuensis]
MEKSDSIFAMRQMRLDENKYHSEFCTINDFDDAIATLFEEFEALEGPLNINFDIKTADGLKSLFVVLMNTSWNLIHKHRGLMRNHDKLKEEHCRITNDNSNLHNQVKRLKEKIEKMDISLYESKERERQLNVKIKNTSCDLKKEKDENVKLKKQLQSKDVQHVHELRRVQQNGNKLQDQFRKSAGTYIPRSTVSKNYYTEQEKKVCTYQKTISRLEENNCLMLQEINELREALELHGIESSGSSADETQTISSLSSSSSSSDKNCIA